MKKVEVYFLINLGAILSLFAIEGELAKYKRKQGDILLEVAKDKLEAMVDGQKIFKGGYISPEPEIVISIRDESGVSVHDIEFFKKFFRGMLEENIYLPPSAYESCFISTEHNEDKIVKAAKTAIKVLDKIKK